MNLKTITTALLIAGFAAPAAFAATGDITFTGSITNVTCRVSGGTPGTNNPDFTVDIGPVNAADFVKDGDVAGTTGFRIYIGGADDLTCPNDAKVWARFEPGSTVNPATGALFTTGGANGVEIRLFDKNGKAIDVWSDKQDDVTETIAEHQAILAYSAGFQRTAAVNAGAANSSVLYSVRFEP